MIWFLSWTWSFQILRVFCVIWNMMSVKAVNTTRIFLYNSKWLKILELFCAARDLGRSQFCATTIWSSFRLLLYAFGACIYCQFGSTSIWSQSCQDGWRYQKDCFMQDSVAGPCKTLTSQIRVSKPSNHPNWFQWQFLFLNTLGSTFRSKPTSLGRARCYLCCHKKQIKVFQDWSGMRASIGTLVFWASKRLLHNTSIWFQIVSKRCWQLKKKSIRSLALCGRSFPSSVIGLPDSQVWGRPLVQSRPPQLQHPPPESWV